MVAYLAGSMVGCWAGHWVGWTADSLAVEMDLRWAASLAGRLADWKVCLMVEMSAVNWAVLRDE